MQLQKSFNQAATLAGKNIIANVKKVKKLGYIIHLNYVYLGNVELAKSRLLERVKNGGHGVPEELIEKRYVKSLENLKIIIPMCDKVSIFSNTVIFNEVATVVDGQVTIMANGIPDFIIKSITNNCDN